MATNQSSIDDQLGVGTLNLTNFLHIVTNLMCMQYWNHRMRTEHNKSPICLWIEGMRKQNPNHCIIDGLHETNVRDIYFHAKIILLLSVYTVAGVWN